MAAMTEASKFPSAELVELRDLRSPDLADVLEEEADVWLETLHWDFHSSAQLVARFVDQRALNGYAIVDRGAVIGYTYFVFDEYKGLIGDLYVRRAWRTPALEYRLLAAAVEALMRTPDVARIETQLPMLGPGHETLPAARFIRTCDRHFMRMGLDRVASLPPAPPSPQIYFAPWEDRYQESAAHLIPDSYRGHIDSRINDQYDSVGGSRRFLYNIIQYPGCGVFFKEASHVALGRESGKLCGVALTSLVAHDTGHITQICVAPPYRGAGLGYELMRQSLAVLRRTGHAAATLTVTAANRQAAGLYERMGFETIRKFRAFVWEGY